MRESKGLSKKVLRVEGDRGNNEHEGYTEREKKSEGVIKFLKPYPYFTLIYFNNKK